MDWFNLSPFSFPFSGMEMGYTMPSLETQVPTAPTLPPDAMIGGSVNPVFPTVPAATNPQGGGAVGADTDKGKAAVDVSSAAKGADWSKMLKGLQAPAAPTPQKISSPNVQAMKTPGASQIAALLASMGVSPQQLMMLSQMRR